MARRVVRASLGGLRRAAHVVADSDRTMADLKRAGMPGDRLTTVHPALALPSSDGGPVTREPGLLLHVGNSGFYKNRTTVLEVLAELRQHADARLILAGSPLTPVERQRIATLELHAHVTASPAPSDAALSRLYRMAAVFIFPSLYEGFGWPPLEAMAHGCPVVCSDAASLPEVVGDAALMAPPTDVTALAMHCRHVLEDAEVAHELVQKGRQNLARFTTQRMAGELTEVYGRLVNAESVAS
jgi:glycosyltransferase involved in cell wall biosynthesis